QPRELARTSPTQILRVIIVLPPSLARKLRTPLVTEGWDAGRKRFAGTCRRRRHPRGALREGVLSTVSGTLPPGRGGGQEPIWPGRRPVSAGRAPGATDSRGRTAPRKASAP